MGFRGQWEQCALWDTMALPALLLSLKQDSFKKAAKLFDIVRFGNRSTKTERKEIKHNRVGMLLETMALFVGPIA